VERRNGAALVTQHLAREIGDRCVGAGQRRIAQEQSRRQRLQRAVKHPVRVARHHLARHRQVDPLDRTVDVEHRGRVTQPVLPLGDPRVAIERDVPVGDDLVVRVARRHPQQLYDARLRLGEAIGGAMVDRQPHLS
jgi:hypothetical protein